jgi:hypothetical protein
MSNTRQNEMIWWMVPGILKNIKDAAMLVARLNVALGEGKLSVEGAEQSERIEKYLKGQFMEAAGAIAWFELAGKGKK